ADARAGRGASRLGCNHRGQKRRDLPGLGRPLLDAWPTPRRRPRAARADPPSGPLRSRRPRCGECASARGGSRDAPVSRATADPAPLAVSRAKLSQAAASSGRRPPAPLALGVLLVILGVALLFAA